MFLAADRIMFELIFKNASKQLNSRLNEKNDKEARKSSFRLTRS